MTNIVYSDSELEYLLSPQAIREKSNLIFNLCTQGKTNFIINEDKLDETANYVIEVINENYPNGDIPYHSRWGHFKVGDLDRTKIISEHLTFLEPKNRIITYWDLAIISVLLDAGAGMQWKYHEENTQLEFSKSEGLALASLHMFIQGLFSHDNSLEVTADGLLALTQEDLAKGFQVNKENPLVGLEGRLKLLHSLGKTLKENSDVFGEFGRPGNLFLKFHQCETISAVDILDTVLKNLGPVWPGRIKLGTQNMGDVWQHPLLGQSGTAQSLIPFHKLSQWLTYSLIEPLEWEGIHISELNTLTGLPEYRNGGLLYDLGVIELKDKTLEKIPHEGDSEIIIEWRALTIVLLDKIYELVKGKLGKSSEEFPMAKVLEGGTWSAGRKIAKEKRSDGGPPLILNSDGTLF